MLMCKEMKLRVLILFSVIWSVVLMDNVWAQNVSDSLDDGFQCIDHSATHDRLRYSSVVGVPEGYVSDRTLYTSIIRPVDVLIDIREDRLDQKAIQSRVNGALQMPLNQLKAKNYLKAERIVILDDGLSGYYLENEVKKLKSWGFKSVKILENGIIALDKSPQYQVESNSHFKSRFVDIERLLGAALIEQNSNNFLFVNLGEESSVLDQFGVESIDIPYSKYQIFYTNLKKELAPYLKDNKDINLVFIHNDSAVYREIFNAKTTKLWSRKWFVDSGISAMQVLLEKVQLTAQAKKRITYTCQS